MTHGESAPAPLWRLNGLQALLAAGSLLNAIAFFAAMPFASLYLASHTALSVPAIGAVVGDIALISSVGGVLGGFLVDRLGAVPVMIGGLAIYVSIYAGLATVQEATALVVLILGLGIARILVEPGGKALLSHAAGDDGRIFRLRYMTLCAGAIIGPLIGGVLYTVSTTAFFAVPAVLYGAYLVLIATRRTALAQMRTDDTDAQGRFPLGRAVRDGRLLAATAAGLVIFFVFSQLESIIPLYMQKQWGDAAHSFAILLIANAVLALAFQIPIDRISTSVSRPTLILMGCACFAAAFACFLAASSFGLALMYLGIVAWTLGEGILLPMPDIAVHDMATGNRKGTYFGFAEIRYLGFFAGPFVGGLLQQQSTTYFTVMGLAVFAAVPLLALTTAARVAVPAAASEEGMVLHADG